VRSNAATHAEKILSLLSLLFLVILTAVMLHGCANMAAPTGGPYDVDPTQDETGNALF